MKKKLSQSISVSTNTVDDNVNDLEDCTGYRDGLKKTCNYLVTYWIAIDADTDVSDVVQIAVFIRGVNEDCQLSVELLDLDPMKGKAGGEEHVLSWWLF